MSTGTFVILGVILAMTRGALGRHKADLSERKAPPEGVTTNTTSKKGLKGRLVVVLVKLIGNSSLVYVGNGNWLKKLGVAYAESS